MAPKKKAIVKKGTTALSTINFADDAHKGMEGADQESYAIPFLMTLQPGSPQIVSEMKGAKAGMYIESITNELFAEVKVIPCAYQRRFLRWTPRDQGGGYHGSYDPALVETGKVEGAEQDERGNWTIDGDDLKDTRMHYILYQDKKGSWKPAILSLTSTQIKKSKRWMSLIRGIEKTDVNGKVYKPASFSHVYTLTTVKEENNKGSWWSVVIEIDSEITNGDVYSAARTCNVDVMKGAVQASEPAQDVKEGF